MSITDLQGTFTLNNGVKMPYFGLGVFQVSDGKEVITSVTDALNAGYRHIDTASLYGNEIGVGEAVRNSNIKRENIFITSKVWNSDQGYDKTLRAFDTSMQKFGFDYLDLYLVHWPVKGKYRDTWKALEEIYNQGRVRAIGLSNFLKHHIDDLMQSANVAPMVNQMEFHPYLIQQDLIDYCNKNKIQYEAWSPLMQGHILNDETLVKLALKHSKTTAQITLRWDLQKGVITIPKSAKKERIISNADIFDFELSEDDIKLIDTLDKNERFGADPDNFDF